MSIIPELLVGDAPTYRWRDDRKPLWRRGHKNLLQFSDGRVKVRKEGREVGRKGFLGAGNHESLLGCLSYDHSIARTFYFLQSFSAFKIKDGDNCVHFSEFNLVLLWFDSLCRLFHYVLCFYASLPPNPYTWSYITWPSYGWHQDGLRSKRLEIVPMMWESAWYYYIQLGAKTQSKTFVKLKPSKSPDKNRVPGFDRLGPGHSWLLLTWDKASLRGKMANNKRSAK